MQKPQYQPKLTSLKQVLEAIAQFRVKRGFSDFRLHPDRAEGAALAADFEGVEDSFGGKTTRSINDLTKKLAQFITKNTVVEHCKTLGEAIEYLENAPDEPLITLTDIPHYLALIKSIEQLEFSGGRRHLNRFVNTKWAKRTTSFNDLFEAESRSALYLRGIEQDQTVPDIELPVGPYKYPTVTALTSGNHVHLLAKDICDFLKWRVEQKMFNFPKTENSDYIECETFNQNFGAYLAEFDPVDATQLNALRDFNRGGIYFEYYPSWYHEDLTLKVLIDDTIYDPDHQPHEHMDKPVWLYDLTTDHAKYRELKSQYDQQDQRLKYNHQQRERCTMISHFFNNNYSTTSAIDFRDKKRQETADKLINFSKGKYEYEQQSIFRQCITGFVNQLQFDNQKDMDALAVYLADEGGQSLVLMSVGPVARLNEVMPFEKDFRLIWRINRENNAVEADIKIPVYVGYTNNEILMIDPDNPASGRLIDRQEYLKSHPGFKAENECLPLLTIKSKIRLTVENGIVTPKVLKYEVISNSPDVPATPGLSSNYLPKYEPQYKQAESSEQGATRDSTLTSSM